MVKAYSPSGLSSFFEACLTDSRGGLIKDYRFIGARGGGFLLEKGVITEVSVKPSKINKIKVYINGVESKNAATTIKAVETLLSRVAERFEVTINHEIELPIGAGFGTSAAGSLTALIALNKAIGLNLSLNELGLIAHEAEIRCRTGLGTVAPLIQGSGCVLTIEPGAPGIAKILNIPVSEEVVVISGIFSPIPTKNILLSRTKLELINEVGRKTLEMILKDLSLENFLEKSRKFSILSGLATERVIRAMKRVSKLRIVGVAQNMIGEGIHVLVERVRVREVLREMVKDFPPNMIFLSKISFKNPSIIED